MNECPVDQQWVEQEMRYRLLGHIVCQKQEHGVYYEQHVDQDQQVVRVPEGIEARPPADRPRQRRRAPSRWPCREQERNDHEDHHGDPGGALGREHDLHVGWLAILEAVGDGLPEDQSVGVGNPREVTGEVCAAMEDDADHYPTCNQLY